MVTGLRILYYEDGKYTSYSGEVDSVDTIKNMNSNTQLVYFESSGAAKTGTTTISLMVLYTFSFRSNGSREASAKQVFPMDTFM